MDSYEMRNILIDYNLAYSETVEIIEKINGVSEETYEDILYVVTGYRNFEDWFYNEVNETSEAVGMRELY